MKHPLYFWLLVTWVATCIDYKVRKGCMETVAETCMEEPAKQPTKAERKKPQKAPDLTDKSFKTRAEAEEWVLKRKASGKARECQITGER